MKHTVLKDRLISGLYGITPDMTNTDALLARTEQVLKGGARLIQYRNKAADKALRYHQAKLLLQLCRSYDIPMIINDYVDLAVEINADGVHVGALDTSIKTARSLLGTNKIIGASCYNTLELAIQAEKNSADYVAFGAFYPTYTKQTAVVAPISILCSAKKILTVPIVSIGGINLTNALPLIKSGVDAVALCSALYQAEDPCKTAETFARFFD